MWEKKNPMDGPTRRLNTTGENNNNNKEYQWTVRQINENYLKGRTQEKDDSTSGMAAVELPGLNPQLNNHNK